jgi:hypothetical protein
MKSCQESNGRAPCFKILCPALSRQLILSVPAGLDVVVGRKILAETQIENLFGYLHSYNSDYVALKRCVFAHTENFLVVMKVFATQMYCTRIFFFNSVVCS